VEEKNFQNYPIPLENIVYYENTASTRGVTSKKFKINNTPKTFVGNATGLWNISPQIVKMAKSLEIIKKKQKISVKAFLSK
jgi:hypothetical protein